MGFTTVVQKCSKNPPAPPCMDTECKYVSCIFACSSSSFSSGEKMDPTVESYPRRDERAEKGRVAQASKCSHTHFLPFGEFLPDSKKTVLRPSITVQFSAFYSHSRATKKCIIRSSPEVTGSVGTASINCKEGCSGLSTWKYQFSYDHWSQATLSSASTWMGDSGSSVAWVLLLTIKVG